MMRKLNCYVFLLFITLLMGVSFDSTAASVDDPLTVVRTVADKIIRQTRFAYRLTLAPQRQVFDGVQTVDFRYTFGMTEPAVAYAYTILSANADTTLTLQIDHNDGCRVWINCQLVYEQHGNRTAQLTFDERSIELAQRFSVALKKGDNELLIKSECAGEQWMVLLQPPPGKGAVVSGKSDALRIGLKSCPAIDNSVAAISNWIIIGPFANPVQNGRRLGLEIEYAPEKEIKFGRMYDGLNGPITWTIPRVTTAGTLYQAQPWGSNDAWNYHNGGVAWAMQVLSELTGETRYWDYASRFCDFHLESIPFVEYQVKTLHLFSSANHQLIETPLLDFTLAPSLPFIYRLRKEEKFSNRPSYEQFIEKMMRYARYEQVRLPGSGIFTRTTPERYTTWVDDMFMGLPFLIQAALYATDEQQRRAFINDAADQVVGFAQQVWDRKTHLYHHARFSHREAWLPYWSRANGWGIWAVTEVLQVLPKKHSRYQAIVTLYRQHVETLIKLQDPNGFWHNVLDRPDSREEVSGTAIFTMAIARGLRHGWLRGEKFHQAVRRGWQALQSRIAPDGTVTDICMGTMCSEDVNYYLNRPFYTDDTHGLFAVLFAGIELHQLWAGSKTR
ncbi:MAG: glycoside hydrolase family 88 protein [candidate division KSB1 bacterium]|nr:glycoside hydrolase family 88 protein [candidate division KSB1 bacterium]